MATNDVDSRQPRGRSYAALYGNGEGPRVMFRAPAAIFRVRGLIDGAVSVTIDDVQILSFTANGDFPIPGGQSAKVVGRSEGKLNCSILT